MNKDEAPTVSFIIPTVGSEDRIGSLVELVERLIRQQGVNFEILICWQGERKPPAALAEEPSCKIAAMDFYGLSLARNIGAEIALGEYLMFLDDDIYLVGDDFCLRAIGKLEKDCLDFLTCNVESSGSIWVAEPITNDVVISRKTIRAHMWEPGLTVRRNAFLETRFDESYGIGCVHGASEGFDFGLRLLGAGYSGKRCVDLLIHHPPLPDSTGSQLDRNFWYSLGNGRALISNRFYGAYLFAIIKACGRLGLAIFTSWRDVPRWLVRIFAMLAGPLIPASPPRILPSSIPRRWRLLSPIEGAHPSNDTNDGNDVSNVTPKVFGQSQQDGPPPP
jgi:glycosyltransferase involved in cell wall biosynthesis